MGPNNVNFPSFSRPRPQSFSLPALFPARLFVSHVESESVRCATGVAAHRLMKCSTAQVADGRRADLARFNLKDRLYIGSTSMDPTLSFIMANLARVKPGDVVYDPFCGTGQSRATSNIHVLFILLRGYVLLFFSFSTFQPVLCLHNLRCYLLSEHSRRLCSMKICVKVFSEKKKRRSILFVSANYLIEAIDKE
jgi:hypothetical protein